MSDIAIRVENLSKRYHIGHRREAYRTLRDSLAEAAKAPIQRLKNFGRASHSEEDTIWALKGISFQVNRGEILGVIGSNGSGKSTLLKVLSRITDPTEGRAEIRGRVGSLLEVGTGFHPELTGRENVYLSGNIIGMPRREIKSKFDEIVDFSGIEKFIDTPVKRYSSGMAVRLGFAVAAHLEPEILLVDEVLAVGDAIFQKKCLGKMADVAKEGRTVLFVSHNMSATNRLCSRAVLLQSGQLVRDGTAADVTSAYLQDASETDGMRSWQLDAAPGTEELRLTAVRLFKDGGTPASVVQVQDTVTLQIEYHVGKPNLRFRCVALFFTQGVCAFASVEPTEETRSATGRYFSAVTIPPHLLTEAEYTVGISIFVFIGAKHHYVQLKDVLRFQVFDPMTGPSARGDYAQNIAGVVRPLLKWKSSSSENGLTAE